MCSGPTSPSRIIRYYLIRYYLIRYYLFFRLRAEHPPTNTPETLHAKSCYQ